MFIIKNVAITDTNHFLRAFEQKRITQIQT